MADKGGTGDRGSVREGGREEGSERGKEGREGGGGESRETRRERQTGAASCVMKDTELEKL